MTRHALWKRTLGTKAERFNHCATRPIFTGRREFEDPDSQPKRLPPFFPRQNSNPECWDMHTAQLPAATIRKSPLQVEVQHLAASLVPEPHAIRFARRSGTSRSRDPAVTLP
jgi:hypothetical protein